LEYLGFIFYQKARVAMMKHDLVLAQEYYRKAHKTHKHVGQRIECALALNSLAECYFDSKRYASARRAAEASKRITAQLDRPRSLALSLILLGQIDEVEDRPAQAFRRWRRAAAIAKKLNDKELRFKTDFVLYRRAVRDGDEAVTRAIGRRLRKLAPVIPDDTDELLAFHQMDASKEQAF
jgi:tetratricopeptide (TPR) repeat protein